MCYLNTAVKGKGFRNIAIPKRICRQMLCSLPSHFGLKGHAVNESECVAKLNQTFTKRGFSSYSSEELLASYASLDHKRYRRTGFPEAVFAEGKTASQVALILDDMARSVNDSLEDGEIGALVGTTILATSRVSRDMYNELEEIQLHHGTMQYFDVARIVSVQASGMLDETTSKWKTSKRPRVVVATAGTTDLPVSEEAAVTLEAAGCEVDRIYDAGVAGLHRIVRAIPRLTHPDVSCVIVCAGMDGALPSVVGGLVSVPVVAVPTSVGYGASFGGISAMLTMLNSCSPGVGVVNIDNGFGAAALAYKCLRKQV
ncbi:predicted protein [Phaeodactylum tricornutum CCAP 1055/1]|uniref:phosphoribosylaminoimidazole carboxylase n=2 Tax=Phaeodactylum tricornutum TaxID=2850 RepID=B7FXS0_PHATC|nr:predicted protein [Phaeodactylum tricornutum CCAP 1055/1]XP_002185193.1 predicted protein [Phaeodactylum tricornutum CCAP 1055/1]EEC43325.1 predicted protein [Phaeodactylum tricornutum CCAP 1055/1]EEC48592.1 predicted protein [Phaeodactylum tricornutum CCAP 1055/1]|eukprot:XP_002179606.1 predicted protein [Phaeodactylum tricornutum CCAP 1055/1]